MNVRTHLENLKAAGVKDESAFRSALALYGRSEVEAAMKEIYPEYKIQEEKRSEPVSTKNTQSEQNGSRALEISDICILGNCPEKTSEYIRSAKTSEEIRKEVVDSAIKARGSNPVNGSASIGIQHDEIDKFRSSRAGAISLRAGVKAEHVPEAVNIRKEGLLGRSLMDLCRDSLEIRGVSTRIMDKDAIISRAMSSGDFPYIIGTGSNRVLGTTYSEYPGTFERWTGKGVLTDFKSTDIVKKSGFSTLDTVMAGEGYRQLSLSEYKESTKLVTLGNLACLNRHMIYNDDLQAFTGILQGLGAAAKRTINAAVYNLLIDNADLSDGVALFHSTHKNVGSTAAISNTTIGQLVQLLRRAVDPNNVALNLPGAFFLCNTLKEALAEQYLGTYNVVYNEGAKIDPYRGKFEIVVDPAIDGAAGAAATRYFLVTDPKICDTITVFYLDGREIPEMFQEESRAAEADGITYKVRFDAVPAVGDFRGMTYNAGA